jgi:RNA polymerase sigma factor (sigma-70 family)
VRPQEAADSKSPPVLGTGHPPACDRWDVRPTPTSDFASVSDADLVVAIADGEAGALRELYARHAPWLGIRLRRRCNDPDLVLDVLQDTFVAVWKGAGKFRGEGDVAAWLWGIGVRRLISQLRGRKLGAEVLVAEVESGASPAAEDAVLLGVEYSDVGSAMAALSPEFRAVIQATVLDGLSTKEASRLLGIPEGTVKTRAMRARVQLRAHLTGGPFAGGTLAGGTT